MFLFLTQFKLWQWGGIKNVMSDYKYSHFDPINSDFVFIRNNIDWLDPFSKNKNIHARLLIERLIFYRMVCRNKYLILINFDFYLFSINLIYVCIQTVK